jgi:hypothetical protein
LKKFIKKFILLALPVLAIVVGVNYYGDAARLFENGFENKIAGILKSGQNVTNITNYNDRIFQREIINSGKVKPTVIVLGSSRAMLISAELYGDSSLFNNTVSSACIKDIIAIYQIYKSNNELPKKVIIGIDPWLFSENITETKWKFISSYYEAFVAKPGAVKTHNADYAKYEELFSLSYFQSSLKNLPAKIKGSVNPIPTSKRENFLITKLTDGSFVYAEEFRNASPAKVENIIKSYLSNDISKKGKLYTVSEEVQNLFKKLITDMKENNIEVEFFLSPFPKVVYGYSTSNYQEIEDIVTKFAKEQKIKVWGTYNPNTLGMDNSYFFDGRHCNEKAMRVLFKRTH